MIESLTCNMSLLVLLSTSCSRTMMSAASAFSMRTTASTPVRLWSSRQDASGSDTYTDASGRKIRTRRVSAPADGWDSPDLGFGERNDQEDWGRSSAPTSSSRKRQPERDDSWQDFDPWHDNDVKGNWGGTDNKRQPRLPPRSKRSVSVMTNRRERGASWDRRDFPGNFRKSESKVSGRFDKQNGNDSRPNKRKSNNRQESGDQASFRAINMNGLEGAGFVHLYGLASVLNALAANRRDLKLDVEKTFGDGTVVDPRFHSDDFVREIVELSDEDDEKLSSTPTEAERAQVKPQAQFRSFLFVQERRESSDGRKGTKSSAADQILELATERDVPIAYVDKGVLNALSGNRPHQGFVLRCGKLYFENLSRIPLPNSHADITPSLWLVLDEVVDPQNLGALLRSAYFLGGGNVNTMGVLVCSKNSAPPSPVVSASSAGALELLQVYSTTNLPRTLNQAREEGFRIIGACSSNPFDTAFIDDDKASGEEGPVLYDLQELPAPGFGGDNRPAILVLGSEGHGLRKLVAKACTEFVRIPSGMDPAESDEHGSEKSVGVDSLNVSVTGGIMLWHLLHGR